ncbi:hypothetical protein K469DRAFT_668252 [Zopfia rhizophila CBS 207.26]|uniref:SnoaL-like domain-containing protein n=1 Tax=Zopfia rhizophila CBS 207.26 TaxID=1314779 RepID=A0A6A6DV58_9PEZI|nr:hypothetical protein K469DRAFT_668252 [Zopfia rhizophila CBS 207.26]
MSPLREQLLGTAITYIEAHKNRDVDALRAIYSPACITTPFPNPSSRYSQTSATMSTW